MRNANFDSLAKGLSALVIMHYLHHTYGTFT